MMNEKKKTILLRILIVVAFLAAIGVCLYLYLHFGKSAIELIKDTERFRAWIDGFGVWGVIVFLAIRIVQTVFKFIPTEPIEIAAGLVWGWFGGLMLCLLGNMIGSVIILFVTRRIGTRILRLFRLEKKMQSMRFLQDREKRNRLLFIFYLVPGTPKDTMTYFAGLTDINRIEFMILSSIARIPAIVFVVSALLSIPGGILYKKISARYVQNRPQSGPDPADGTETGTSPAQKRWRCWRD